MSKKLLYLAFDFPRIGKGNNLYTDLMEEFRDHGYQVYVIACAQDAQSAGYSDEAGLHVIRAKVPEHQNVGNIKKGISILTMPYAYSKALKKHLPRDISFDLIVMPTPPITLAGLAAKLKKKYKAPVYLILRDIFPQNAVDLGFMSAGGLMHRFFCRMERKLYATADKIGCMSPANIEFVKKHNPEVDAAKLHILRNWQRAFQLEAVDKQAVKEEMGMAGKFLLFFGGNIGKPQRVENLVALAKELVHREEFLLYVVGNGTEADKLKQLVSEAALSNVIIKDFVPRETYFKLMQMADGGLISLDPRFTIPNIPSKVLSYFNRAIPVIAIIDTATDFGYWVQDEIRAGYWTTYDKIPEIAKKVELLIDSEDTAEELGKNGFDYFNANLLPEHAFQTIEDQMA